MNYRNRKLLDLAHDMPCMMRIQGVCTYTQSSEPAHSNSSRHGKGLGLKSHDFYFASACGACHSEYDGRTRILKLNREQLQELWDEAHKWTREWIIEHGPEWAIEIMKGENK